VAQDELDGCGKGGCGGSGMRCNWVNGGAGPSRWRAVRLGSCVALCADSIDAGSTPIAVDWLEGSRAAGLAKGSIGWP